MPDDKTIADPSVHYGSPKAATRAFTLQRITGGLNVLFLAFLIWLVVSLAGAGRDEMIATIAHPMVALVLALLVVNVCVHMRIGMREIIEDYVHDPRLNRLSLGVNDIFAILVALAGLVSILAIVFRG
jgi:succinate dehydrogenase / fumarate reductase membrane anchor subunit